jgi:hypothetical protein
VEIRIIAAYAERNALSGELQHYCTTDDGRVWCYSDGRGWQVIAPMLPADAWRPAGLSGENPLTDAPAPDDLRRELTALRELTELRNRLAEVEAELAIAKQEAERYRRMWERADDLALRWRSAFNQLGQLTDASVYQRTRAAAAHGITLHETR